MAGGLDSLVQSLDSATRSASESTRQRLVEEIVRLYTTLRACHDAYVRMESHKSDVDEVDHWQLRMAWEREVEALTSVLASLRPTLEAFAPELYDSVSAYHYSEVILLPQQLPAEGVSEEFRRWEGAGGSFDGSMRQMGEFIRTNFTMEEVFGASAK